MYIYIYRSCAYMLFSMHKTFVCSHMHMYWLHAYIIIFQYACTCIKCKWLTWRKEFIYIYIHIYIPPEVHTLLPLSWPPHAHLCWCHARGRAWASRLCQNGGIWCWEPKIMRDGLEGCVLNSPQQLTHVHPVGPFFFKKKTPGLTVTASNGVEKGNYQLSFRGRAARLADVWMFYHWEKEMSPL